MIRCGLDSFRCAVAAGCDAALRPWLHDRGSLTQRIRQRCRHFEVLAVCSAMASITFDERSLLGLRPDRLAHVREALLKADGRPVVFARSVCAPAHLRGPWQEVRGLGNRSLGGLLFPNPLVIREALRFRALGPDHPLRARMRRHLGPNPQPSPDLLWARRSLFRLHGAPLLLTEVFLPEVSNLGKRTARPAVTPGPRTSGTRAPTPVLPPPAAATFHRYSQAIDRD